jgi:hypothetical protein
MLNRDPHVALKSSVVRIVNAGHLEIALAMLQWSKDEKGYSLHVNPTSISNAGLQTTDLLGYLGFQRNERCSFTNFNRCYSKWVDGDFDVERFAAAFNSGYGHLSKAQRELTACGFELPQPEGWGFYYGKPSGRSNRSGPGEAIIGDGHTAIRVERMQSAEDERFQFQFTFIESGNGEAFVTHYRPKHFPVSAEIKGVFKYLGLNEFKDCPEFDFEPCFFRTLRFIPRGDNMWGGNVEHAHRVFNAHATHFSSGVENLLAANAAVEAVGMAFLPLIRPADRMRAEIATKVVQPTRPAASKPTSGQPASTLPDTFDVAISFAGTERDYALKLAKQLRDAGYAVFYDDFYPEQLWGKNLTVFFDDIFRKRARYCVIFVSKEYRTRKWTNHEARSAQARALQEKGNEYILPVQIDGTELDGLLPTIGYVSIEVGIEKVGNMLIKKLAS